MTQEELGKLMGVTGVTIMRYEKGQREPSLEQLQKIADILHVEPSYLVGWHTGFLLERIRQEHGLSQEVLAQKADIPLNDLQAYEQNPETVKVDALAKLLSALGHPIEDTQSYREIRKAEALLNDAVKENEDAQYGVRVTKLEMAFLMLNERGQRTAIQRLVELAQIPDYQNQEVTAEQRSAVLQECEE